MSREQFSRSDMTTSAWLFKLTLVLYSICRLWQNAVELRRLSDSATKHLHAFQALKRHTTHWDDLLVHLLTSKLDSLTLREWRTLLAGNELPSVKQLLDFIAHRCQMLEPITRAGSTSARKIEAKSQPNAKRSSCAATVKPKCNFYQGEHVIYYCKNFVTLPISKTRGNSQSQTLRQLLALFFSCVK